jgi:hypothetical protein
MNDDKKTSNEIISINNDNSNRNVYDIIPIIFDSDSKSQKQIAPFSPLVNDGLDGDPAYFKDKLLPFCARRDSPVNAVSLNNLKN